MIRALARRQSNPCFWPLPLQQLAELEALLPPGPSVHLAGERPRRHAFGAASPLHLSGVAISLRGGGQQESTLRVAEPWSRPGGEYERNLFSSGRLALSRDSTVRPALAYPVPNMKNRKEREEEENRQNRQNQQAV